MRGRLALDGSVLIELTFSASESLELQNLILDNVVEPHTTEIAEAELRYILCRRIGKRQTEQRVNDLRSSGYMRFESIAPLVKPAAAYKCERSISLADCFCLAQAQMLKCPAFFVRREKDLAREMEKRAFDVPITFLHG